ncbi:tRNA (guanosine(37)-N1)-methyltransferase TrmD [Candidatus Dependentiae bacterium]|nr:tRNA (guanosine(37)-N1)-methyltransferase TrmD [Candidatus Dependentiae bacterium]
MNVSILTLFPDLYRPFLQTSLLKRAQENKLVSFSLYSLFDFVAPKERIDDATFGHNSGMLIKPEVIEKAMNQVENNFGSSLKIVLSPQGKKLDQRYVKELWGRLQDKKQLVLLASRYEGIDARVEQYYADEVISVGDFITMGGDMPAMLLIEALLRYMPGIVGKQESVEKDSFSGAFIDHPEYTKPVEWKGMSVPEILRSGNHAAIAQWQEEKAAEWSVKRHFDWVRSCQLTQREESLVRRFIPHHYVALMHSDILLKEGRIGTTSITSIDVHDIARSSATYGLKGYFIVTPINDQQMLVRTMLDFWHSKEIGGEYNKHRHEAIALVHLQDSLASVIVEIEKREGKKPIIIGTSARLELDKKMLNYHQQSIVWQQERPVLFLFGTGHGMSEQLLNNCDYMLQPLQGYSDFNHLSVRSAAAIIFDKWFGVSLK